MDIFSSIKNIQNNHIEYDLKTTDNNQKMKSAKTQAEQSNEIRKHQIEKKSKEEIKKELQKIVAELNEKMNPLNINLEFKFNNKIDELTVMVVDKKKS